MNDILIHANRFMLVLIRTSGVVMVAPVFGTPMVPMRVKAAFVMLVSFVLTPVVTCSVPALDNIAAFGTAAVRELGVGLVMGFSSMLVFSAFDFAGELVGKQMGLAMGEEANPLFEDSSTVLSQFHNILALLLFLSINGHHWFLQALGASFQRVPLGGMELSAALTKGMMQRFIEMFSVGLKMAAPAVCVLLLLTVSLAMLARAAPMLNMLMISISLRIAAGLMLIGLLLPYVYSFGMNLFFNLRTDLDLILKAM